MQIEPAPYHLYATSWRILQKKIKEFSFNCIIYGNYFQVNCTTIDWFHSWPEEALYSTAFNFFKTQFTNEISIESMECLSKVGVEMHVNKSTQKNKNFKIKALDVTSLFY